MLEYLLFIEFLLDLKFNKWEVFSMREIDLHIEKTNLNYRQIVKNIIY